MITNTKEAKSMKKHISCDYKCQFNSKTCNSSTKWNNKTCQCECKNYHKCKKDYSWNPGTCICQNSKYFKNITKTSLTECDETIIVIDIASMKKTNTIATNIKNNCHSKKVKDCYILHTVLLVIILLLIITIICYHYAKHRSK